MRAGTEMVARLAAIEAELGTVQETIAQLAPVVMRGGNGWLQALEALAAAYQQRKVLQVQVENLHWILTPEILPQAS